jgi:hypothetical protein
LGKMDLKSCNICKIITHRYMHLCWEPQLLASALLATQGNKQVASAVQKDHIQMLSSWNQLNLTGYNIVHFAENTLCSHFRK